MSSHEVDVMVFETVTRLRTWLLIALISASGVTQLRSQTAIPAQLLSESDVIAILNAGASALADSTMTVAVVDRNGAILGGYRRAQASPGAVDAAVSLARTGAFFSNDQAPLSSRTVRFISGIHFPPGIPNTPNAALYGIENTNRGCALGSAGDGVFNSGRIVPRARSVAGTFSTAAGQFPLPCRPSDTRGCGLGISTGKVDVFDSGGEQPPVNPGGLPLYRAGRLIGGVGVAGVPPDHAEFAAAIAAAGTRSQTGITTAITFPDAPLAAPGAVFIDGIRLPFFRDCRDFACVADAVQNRPVGTMPGSFSTSELLTPSIVIPPPVAAQVPEGYLIGPRPSTDSVGLTADDVRRLVEQAVTRADVTRAQIRLPLGSATRMIIAITDRTGAILGAFRMPDATVFSLDVAIAKARNAFYFSTREGYEVLRDYVERHPTSRYIWEPNPPAGKGWALTNRTLSFGGQPLFPPGIDRERRPTSGPWFDLFQYDSANPCTEGPGPSRGANRSFDAQGGIVWFPGSAPLYKNGELVGGIGVSGDGVEQDDYVTAAAVDGFTPPDDLRVDQSFIRLENGEAVRLPYFKFPRNPEQR